MYVSIYLFIRVTKHKKMKKHLHHFDIFEAHWHCRKDTEML